MQLSPALPFGWISDPSGPDLPIGYSGYVFNNESGLYTVRNRDYSPDLGRWVQRDPMGYADGMSVYQYVRSEPGRFMDPLGLDGSTKKAAGGLLLYLIESGVRGYWDEQSADFLRSAERSYKASKTGSGFNSGIIGECADRIDRAGKFARASEYARWAGKGLGGFGVITDAIDGTQNYREGDFENAAADYTQAGVGIIGVLVEGAGPLGAAIGIGIELGQVLAEPVDEYIMDSEVVNDVVNAGTGYLTKKMNGLGSTSHCAFLKSMFMSRAGSQSSRCNAKKAYDDAGCGK